MVLVNVAVLTAVLVGEFTGVLVRVNVYVGVLVYVNEGDAEAVALALLVNVPVAVRVYVAVAVLDGETVDDGTMDDVYVDVTVLVKVGVPVRVNVKVGVMSGVLVLVREGVNVAVLPGPLQFGVCTAASQFFTWVPWQPVAVKLQSEISFGDAPWCQHQPMAL
jgi:hypothetical protein